MTAPLLTRYGRNAELALGLQWIDKFESNEWVRRNDLTIAGSPTINDGAILTAANTDYLQSAVNVETEDAVSFMYEFTPGANFTLGSGTIRYWSASAAGSGFHYLRIIASDEVQLAMNNAVLYTFDDSNLAAQWVTGGRNVVVATVDLSDGDHRQFWLNGVEIYDANAGALATFQSMDDYTLGASAGGGFPTDTTYHSVRIFNRVLTDQEIIDYWNQTTWRYRENTAAYYPLRAAQHDPVNTQTIDASGNGYNATFGAGGDTPTKITRRGYTFDGGDFMTTTLAPPTSGSLTALVKFDSTSDLVIMGSQANRCYLGVQGQRIAGGIGTQSWTTIIGGLNDRVDVGVVHSCMLTWDGTTVCLYLDGVQVYSAAQAGAVGSNAIYLGALNNAGSDALNWVGDIYEASVFSRCLTPLQVMDHHLDMIGRLNDV